MMQKSEAGVALISVLLLVALASFLAVSMMTEQRLALERGINHRDQAQAWQYALGGEELARQLLYRQYEESQKETENPERVQQITGPLPPFDFPGGEVHVQIQDLQGRFNLNSLALRGADGALAMRRFRRLVRQLELSPSLADQLADYLDPDTSARRRGAEDFAYLLQEPPYRAANSLLAHPSELNWLPDMNAEALQKLLPLVTALPFADTSININTAPAEVLQALVPRMTKDETRELLRVREAGGGFKSLNDFWRQPTVRGRSDGSSQLSLASNYYEVQVRARYNNRVSRLFSMVAQRKGNLETLARDLGQDWLTDPAWLAGR